MPNWQRFTSYTRSAVANIKSTLVSNLLVVAGLSVAIISSALILSYVIQHLTFERDIEDSSSIYRVNLKLPDVDLGGDGLAVTPGRVKTFLESNLGEDSVVTHFLSTDKLFPITLRGIKVDGFDPLAIDDNFFKVFKFKGIDKPDFGYTETGAVISDTLAQRLFGNDVKGSVINLNGTQAISIEGTFKPLTEKTHLQFNSLISLNWIENINPSFLTRMRGGNFYTYVKSDASPSELANVERMLGDVLTESMRVTVIPEFKPIEEIHLTQGYLGEMKPVADTKVLYLVLTLGAALIFIGAFNFYNMFSAKLTTRRSELGIHSVLGASKRDIYSLVLVEYLALLVAALLLSLVCLEIAFGTYFADLVGIKIPLGLTLGLATILFLVTTVVLSIALFIHIKRLDTVQAVVGANTNIAGSHVRSKSVLVACQVFLSVIILYLGFNVSEKALELSKIAPGFISQNVWVSPQIMGENVAKDYDYFKSEVQQYDGVESVTYAEQVPSMSFNDATSELTVSGIQNLDLTLVPVVGVDYDYFKTIGAEILAGSGVTEQMAGFYSRRDNGVEKFGAVVTEAFVSRVGWEKPESALGNVVRWDDKEVEIIGVVSDLKFDDLQSESPPIIFGLGHEAQRKWNIAVKLSDEASPGTLRQVEKRFDAYFNRAGTQFEPLNQLVTRKNSGLYSQLTVLANFALVVISLSLIGVFALTKFGTERRQRELSIRLVIGASKKQLHLMLQRSFLSPAALSSLASVLVIWSTQPYWAGYLGFSDTVSPSLLFLSTSLVVALASITVVVAASSTLNKNYVRTLQSE